MIEQGGCLCSPDLDSVTGEGSSEILDHGRDYYDDDDDCDDDDDDGDDDHDDIDDGDDDDCNHGTKQ